MSKIKMKKEITSPAIPESGYVTIYPEGSSVKFIDDVGVIHTFAEGMTREQIEDLLANSFNNTSSISWVYSDVDNYFEASLNSTLLSKLNGIETGATADQTASEIKSLYESNANTNVFTDSFQSKLSLIMPNRYPYVIKTSSYTFNLTTEGAVLCAGSAPMTITIPESTNIPNDGHVLEIAIANMTTFPVTIQLSASDVFTVGVNTIILNQNDVIRVAAGYPTIGPNWFILQNTTAVTQSRRNATWTATSFSSATAVPFDTTDIQTDSNRIQRDLTNTTRVNIKTTGRFNIGFSAAIDSTGGSSYSVTFYLRKNGSVEIPGSRGSVGNYVSEDSYFAKTIEHLFTAGDYVELVFSHTSLTGNANNILLLTKESR